MDEIAITFLWDQWSQLGLSGSTTRDDHWAMDPEALVLLTLRAGPRDARLFDEVLDWLCVNGRWISAKRLRNLAKGNERDERLVDAAISWVGSHETSLQLWKSPTRSEVVAAELEPLADLYVGAPDPSFAAQGLAWPRAKRSKKSQSPDLARPVALALQLRALLGTGARAEVVRYLYLIAPREASVAEIASAAGFGKRNASNTLHDLDAAAAVRRTNAGNGHRYALFANRWDPVLGVGIAEDRPLFVPWTAMLDIVARLADWSVEHRNNQKSDYMLASDARQVVDELRSELDAVGIRIPVGTSVLGEEYLPAFEALTQEIAAALDASVS